jgi:hypothetical protein
MVPSHDLQQVIDAVPLLRRGEEAPPRERQPRLESPIAAASRAIFRKWLALHHRGIDLGSPLTDPLPGPYGAWYRVYRRGRIYWHADPRMNARLGAFVRAPA